MTLIDVMPSLDGPDNLINIDGELYFMAQTAGAGFELHRLSSDSLIATLIDVNRETLSSFPSDFFVI